MSTPSNEYATTRDNYFGGTPTAGYADPNVLSRTPQGLRQEEDFSSSTWLKDWWETKGAANRARKLARNPSQAPTANNSRAGVGSTQWQQWQLNRAAALDAEFDRRNEFVGVNHPIMQQVVDQARAAGVQLAPGDMANLVRVGELERVKNVLMDRVRVGDNRGVGNIMLTLKQRDPKLAAMVPPLVEDQLKEIASAVAEDPNVVQNAISWLGTDPNSPGKWALDALSFVNDQVRHVGAAIAYRPDDMSAADEFSGLLVPLRVAQNWDATSRGSKSEQRLDALRKEYPPQIVDAALDIQQRLMDGDGSVFAEILSDETTDPMVLDFVRDILYNGPGVSTFDAQGLREGIEGARTDNMGDLLSSAVADIAYEQNGDFGAYTSKWRGTMSQVSNLVWELGADPLNYVGVPIRAVTATKYAITKLAPNGMKGEAARAPIASALRSQKVGGVEMNRSRRYFEGIMDQLDRIDEFVPGSVEASSAWQRLVRQHKEIPEDILLQMADVKNIPKVNGKRTMDGVVVDTADGSSRRADGMIDWITNQNEQWQAAVGKASEKAKLAGESFLIDQAIKAKLIDELEPDDLVALAAGKRPQSAISTDEILAIAREKLPDEVLARADEIVDGALRKQGATEPYLAARFRQAGKRDQVMPYTGVLGDLRRRAVNGIIAERIGATRTKAIIDEFIGDDMSPEAVARALDTPKAQAEMAGQDRGVLGSSAPGRKQALSDRVSGLLSSMPNGRFINIKTGENSQEVYRFARMFYTRKTAEFLADKFRRGDEGTRRLILAGLIRSSAASRGVSLSAEDVWARIGDLATGSRGNEMFAIPTPGSPSGDMMKATLDEVERAAKARKKLDKRVARLSEELDRLQAQLDGAVDAGDESAAASLERQVRKASAKLAKNEQRAANAARNVERYKKRLITALGRNDEPRPSAMQQRIPAAMAGDIEDNLQALAEPGLYMPPAGVFELPDELFDDAVDVVSDAAPVAPAPVPNQAQAELAMRLPNDLSGAKLSYKGMNVTFDNDLDRALFIVRNGVTRSKRDADYMEWLREQLPNVSDEMIRARGEGIAQRLEISYRDTVGDTIDFVNPLRPPSQAQQVLDDSGDLVDEVPTVGASDPAVAQQVDQMALDARGMTPPPERMSGGSMQEMPFDEPVALADGLLFGTQDDLRVVAKSVGGENERYEITDGVARVVWGRDGDMVSVNGTPEEVRALIDWYDSNDLTQNIMFRTGLPDDDAIGAFVRDELGKTDWALPAAKSAGKTGDTVSVVLAAESTTDGAPLVGKIDRPAMPLDPVKQLAFPDRDAGYGYATTVAADKGANRDVVVTMAQTRHGNPVWKFELGKNPTQEYDLTTELRFDEWGNMTGMVWRPGADNANNASKAKSTLLAKAIVAEAKKYDIPVRGELRTWLDEMGAKPNAENSKPAWNPRAVINMMSHDELDIAAEWILRHEPSLGQRPLDDMWGPPIQRSNILGRGRGGQYPGISWENPLVRRWLAAYLGLVDGVPKPDVEALRAAAFAHTTRNIPGDWTRTADRTYTTPDGWKITWEGQSPTKDMPWLSTDGGNYVLTDPSGTVIKRELPGVGGETRELDWGDLAWAIDEANSRRGIDEFLEEDRWDQIDEIDEVIASPALDPAKDTLQGLPTFDEFLEASPRFGEFSDLMESLGQRYDERLYRELNDLDLDLAAEWASMILKDPDVRAQYLATQGVPDGPVPDNWRQHFGDEFDNQTIEAQQGLNMGNVEAGGTRVFEVREDVGLGDNFHVHGGVTRNQIMDLIDRYGEEEVWAWWNTGNFEAAWNPDFLATYGAAPKLRPDPGKGLPAARRAAQVPGEYTNAEFTIKTARRGSTLAKKIDKAKRELATARQAGDDVAAGQAEFTIGELTRRLNSRKAPKPTRLLRVPWKGSRADREDYILRKYADLQEAWIEEAMQGADRPAIQRYVDAALAERTAARRIEAEIDDAVDDVVPVVDEVVPVVDEVVPVVDEAAPVVDEVSPVPASEDVIEGTVLARVDEPIPAAAAPPAQPPGEPPRGLEGAGAPEPDPRMPKTGELAQWLAKYQNNGDRLPTQVINGEAFVTPSRDEFGREHAVHLYQTSDYVVIPHLAEIEAFGRIRENLPWLANSSSTFMGRTTDLWSLATLYGLRFAMRSSVEDLMTFSLTGGLGHLGDLQRGRRGSTAIREASPHIASRVKKGVGSASDETELVTPATDEWWALGRKRARTSRLGMVARTSRHLADFLQRGNVESTRSFWLKNLTQEEVLTAAAEMQAGRYGAMQALIAKAVGRMHFTGLDAADTRALELLGGTYAGRKLLESMAEAGAQINSGSFRTLDDAMRAVADNADLSAIDFTRPVNFGEFKRLALSANDKADPFVIWFWHRSLQAIVRDDGPVGHIFVKLMHDPDRAKKAIADAIRKDTRFGYKERFSLINSDTAIDDFANRYYEASLPYFQRADGTINEALRGKFIDTWIDPKSGKSKMRVSWYVEDSKGRSFTRVSDMDLSRMERADKPMYVLGRAEKVVMPINEKALMDRPWDWMGNQYARIAREPIFIGNYISNMRALSPTQNQLAQAMANGRAGKVGAAVSDVDRKAAEAIVASQAQDAAYAFTLNYMDNPANRSVLAWKVRNVARYYRATEDFARRATRIAKNYPDAYYKLAMTYHVLEDTGFTYRDDDGDLYFAYPANSYLQDAFSAVSSLFQGFGTPVAADPFVLGGLVKNISPSTDPEQWAPTFTGVITLPLTAIFHQFPSLEGLRTLTMGPYSTAGTTGNLAGELFDAITPAGVKKIWSNMEPSERDASLASASAGAIASMIADGKFDHVVGGDTPLTLEQLKKDDVYAESQRRAFGLVISKLFMGYATPAAPQVYQNNVTQFARESGIESINSLFRDLIEENDGDVAAAYADWQRMDPDGKLLPFTVSKTKNNPDMLKGLTGAQPYAEVIEWTRQPENALLANKFPDAYMFLAPQTGEFDWSAWGILKSSGFRVSKTENEMVIDMFAAQGEQQDRKLVAEYEAAIAAQDPETDEGKAAIRELEAARTAEREDVKNRNPYWATKSQTRLEPYDVESIRQQFVQTQQMMDYLRERNDGELTGSAAAIDAAMQVWLEMNVAKSMISYYTDEGKDQRAQIDRDLEYVLAEIGASDPTAANFIETILSNRSLFGRLM